MSALAVIKMVLVDVLETEKRDCYGAQIVIFWRNKCNSLKRFNELKSF